MADFFAMLDDANRARQKAYETGHAADHAIADYFVARLHWSPTFEEMKERAQRRLPDRCTGCGAPHCGHLWAGQRKCCPDCSHGRKP